MLEGARKSVPFLIMAVFLACAGCATVDTEYNTQRAGAHYKMGVAYYSENKIQQAFVEFQRAYELNPKNKEVLNAIGVIYLLHFEETEKAMTYFEKAIAVDPQYSEAYNNLGFANERLGHFEAAISLYRKAVSNVMYKTPEKAYWSMGNSYYRLGRYEEALKSYREALKRAPDLGPVYLGMSLCFNAMGRYGDAAEAMNQAIKLDSVYKGDREKALEDFKQRKLTATGYDRQNFSDYIEILKY